MFLAVMESKYGTDYYFESTLTKAQEKVDKHAKSISRQDSEDRNSYDLGPHDAWCIYKIEDTVPENQAELIKFLNNLFNLIHVNPSLLETIESRSN